MFGNVKAYEGQTVVVTGVGPVLKGEGGDHPEGFRAD